MRHNKAVSTKGSCPPTFGQTMVIVSWMSFELQCKTCRPELATSGVYVTATINIFNFLHCPYVCSVSSVKCVCACVSVAWICSCFPCSKASFFILLQFHTGELTVKLLLLFSCKSLCVCVCVVLLLPWRFFCFVCWILTIIAVLSFVQRYCGNVDGRILIFAEFLMNSVATGLGKEL